MATRFPQVDYLIPGMNGFNLSNACKIITVDFMKLIGRDVQFIHAFLVRHYNEITTKMIRSIEQKWFSTSL